VPELKLGPQSVFHPSSDRWMKLHVAKSAQPLKEQEITAQRDEINRKLDAIKNDLIREQRGVYKARQETRDQEKLSPEQQEQVKDLRNQNKNIEEALRDVARTAEKAPELQRVADRAQDLADQEMRAAIRTCRTPPAEGSGEARSEVPAVR
jgi:predicted  nucleic acid-binding Zn-ribbon protein